MPSKVSERRPGAPDPWDLDADAYSVREVARSRGGGGMDAAQRQVVTPAGKPA